MIYIEYVIFYFYIFTLKMFFFILRQNYFERFLITNYGSHIYMTCTGLQDVNMHVNTKVKLYITFLEFSHLKLIHVFLFFLISKASMMASSSLNTNTYTHQPDYIKRVHKHFTSSGL